MRIVIDTREQRPWSFPEYISTVISKIDAGDYALEGDNRFAIERKSANDFAGTIGSGWPRFCRELKRMDDSGFIIKVIIVEATLEDFCYRTCNGQIVPPDHGHYRITPKFLMKRVAQLTLRGASVIFAGDAELAAAIAYRILKERYEEVNNETKRKG